MLSEATLRPLTLVAAPAGWGKTELMASWVRSGQAPGPVVWVDADAGNPASLPRRFAEALVQAGCLPEAPADVRVDDLMRMLHQGGRRVLVVLDDFQEVTDPAMVAGLETLAGSSESDVRVLVGCRTDASVPLYRWRMRGTVTEIRAGHLAFTLSEVVALLGAHGITLAEPALVELRAITEGWPAALRLGALAMQGQPEPERLVRQFALHDRALGEYIVSEVLAKLDPDVRDVLLRTSVLDHLSPELIQALTGRTDGAQILASLEHSNLFVSHCGGTEPWYRVHPLFGLLLYTELRQREPELLPELHRRAVEWFSARDMSADAVRHALAAREWARAADVVDRRWQSLLPGGRLRSLKSIVPAPPQEVQQDPRLALAFAAERLDAHDLQSGDAYLHLAGRSMLLLPDDSRDRLHSMVNAFRFARAHLRVGPDQLSEPEAKLVEAAEQTVPATAGDESGRALTQVALGTGRLYHGDLAGAEFALLEGLELARISGLVRVQLAALRQLAVATLVRGRFTVAARYARDALGIAGSLPGLTQSSDAVWSELVLAELHTMRDRLLEGVYHLDRALFAGAIEDPALIAASSIMRARVGAALGDPQTAATSLAAVRRQLSRDGTLPLINSGLTLAEAELRLQLGDVVAARRLLLELGSDHPLRVWSAVVRAKVQIAERRPAVALDGLLSFVESVDDGYLWFVEANLVHAQAAAATGQRAVAEHSLERALRVAEDEEVRRPFLALGPAARSLLTTYLPAGTQYRRLAEQIVAQLTQSTVGESESAGGRLVEPLTERELTVLRYLQSMMSTAEIASVLYVSINTVKTHVKSIYRKLGTGKRRDAVERARQLQLI